MTNKKSTKMIALLTALVLVTACFIGGTIARYVTSTSSEDEARVAIWGINGDNVTMDIFNATYELADGTIVAQSNDGDKIIAPGTSKDNYFSIVNTDDNLAPEVMYEVRISLDDSEINPLILNNPSIQWRLDNGAYGTWEETKAQVLALVGHESGVKTYAPGELADKFKAGETHTIGWTWIMDNNNDEMDTEMGNAAANSDIVAKINIKVVARQVDVDTTGMLDGNGQVLDFDNPQPLTFRSSAPVNELEDVTVNDGTETTTLVRDVDYTVSEGSTIITLVKEWLERLAKGNYTISIISKNQTAKATFKVDSTQNSSNITHKGKIPTGGIYYQNVEPTYDEWGDEYFFVGDYNNGTQYVAGDKFPIPQTGDVYIYGDYEYRYNMDYSGSEYFPNDYLNGWSVAVLDNSKSSYDNILTNINGKNVVTMKYTFYRNNNIVIAPTIPNTVIDLEYAFYGCESLTKAPVIPSSVTDLWGTFYNCVNLTGDIEINANPTEYDEAIYNTKLSTISGTINPELKIEIAKTIGSYTNTTNHKNIIPIGGTYYVGVGETEVRDYTNYTQKLVMGDNFPETVTPGDIYLYGNYEYRYGMEYDYTSTDLMQYVEGQNGWTVRALGDFSSYGPILSNINNQNVTNMKYTFALKNSLTVAPKIPSTVTNLSNAFQDTQITVAPEIPNGVTNLNTTFSSCGKLTTPPSSIPETVTSMSKTFMSCSNLESVPSVPSKVTNLYYAFYGCKKLTGDIEINANPTKYGKALSGTNITSISGSTTLKDELLATKNN